MTHFIVTPGTQVSAHDDGLAFLHIPSGRVFLCNRIGARIWKGALSGLSPESVSEQISVEYGVPRDRARQDTCSFLSQLERNRLVTQE